MVWNRGGEGCAMREGMWIVVGAMERGTRGMCYEGGGVDSIFSRSA